jgi:signal transduction histidine kinase/uncharacterized protein YpmB
MKIKSLYTKLLLSFLGVLFITIVMIFVLFLVTAGRTFKHQVSKQSVAKLLIFKEVVQEKVDKKPLVPLEKNQDVNGFLKTLSDLFDLKIWVTDSDNKILVKTFSSPISMNKTKLEDYDLIKGGIKLYHLSHRHIKYYAQIPVKVGNEENTLHIHLDNEREKPPEVVFPAGLLCIGAVIALLLVPLAGIITKRIKLLKKSALELAHGDLSSRARIKGYDEIAELGDSFNFMADKLEKMIQGNKELSANISHELRSPLTRIRVSKELIQDKLDENSGSDLHRYIQNIDQDIESLDALIDKILKLSKMDYQESSLSLEKIDFNLLLKDLEKRFRPSLKQKNLTLKMDVMASLTLHADKSILTSILSNLIDNAVKYTKEDGKIHIAAFKQEEGNLIFNITNTYRRLNPAEIEKLFEPFYRIKGNSNPGSGLGLTIVKKQLKQCNGIIVARNSEEGLMFEIEFSN